MKSIGIFLLGILLFSSDLRADQIPEELIFTSRSNQKKSPGSITIEKENRNSDHKNKTTSCVNSLLKLKTFSRNFDGTDNNCQHPDWGSANSDLLRICPANYADGKSKLWGQKPNVRQVSNVIGQREGPLPKTKLGLNLMYPIFGQFLDHDTSLTPSDTIESDPILVPRCDKYFDPNCTGTQQIPFNRAKFNPKKPVRTNLNIVTSWMDASQIYGSSKQVADSLRSFKCGKVKTSEGNLLVKDDKGNFLAGDFRANQNIGLIGFHTAFMREHNRLCDIILKTCKNLNDQEIYTIARNYVIGLWQHIVFDEYIPELIGKANFNKYIGAYKYEKNTSPNVYTEFSSAGYRLHSLVYQPFVLMDEKGKLLKTLKEGEMLGNPALVTSKTLTSIFYGMLKTPMKERTLQVSNQLRNFLQFGPIKTDIYSINLERGRDTGLCSIPCLRQALNLTSKKTFSSIFEDQTKAKLLERIYQSIQNVDLYLAVLGQKLTKDSVLGQMAAKLNAIQWKNIRNADKYWYEAYYPAEIVKEIKATSLADVLQRNLGLKNVCDEAFKQN